MSKQREPQLKAFKRFQFKYKSFFYSRFYAKKKCYVHIFDEYKTDSVRNVNVVVLSVQKKNKTKMIVNCLQARLI